MLERSSLGEEKERRQPFVRKDVHEVELSKVKDLCVEKHKVVDYRITALEKATDSINRKIMAALVFSVMTLIAVLVAIATHALS
jgi:hypothetical protein